MRSFHRTIDKCSPWLAPAIAAAIAVLGAAPSPVIAPVAAHEWDGDSYILLSGGERGATMMSGHTDDLKRARALQQGGAPLLYLKRGGKAYVVRDAATLEKARAIFKPQEELGRQQAALGSRQAALGSQQAALGAQQAKLALRHATSRGSDDTARAQDALGKQQAELGERQGALGEEQAKLGERQEKLGREARASFRALVADAVRRGLATPV